jgi:hypothetical protein
MEPEPEDDLLNMGGVAEALEQAVEAEDGGMALEEAVEPEDGGMALEVEGEAEAEGVVDWDQYPAELAQANQGARQEELNWRQLIVDFGVALPAVAELSEFPSELAELKWCDDGGLEPLWCVHNATASKGKTKHYLNIYYENEPKPKTLGRFSLEHNARRTFDRTLQDSSETQDGQKIWEARAEGRRLRACGSAWEPHGSPQIGPVGCVGEHEDSVGTQPVGRMLRGPARVPICDARPIYDTQWTYLWRYRTVLVGIPR